jgi:hypothetical protein
MKLPNFIIAGGVATGTSFLSHAIYSHSQIYLPKVMRPECGFFYKSWEFSKGLDYYSKRWFSDVKDEIAIGERSSLYIHGDFLNVAGRIREHLPNVKLVFCLRNPTERAYANYRFSVLTGYEKLSFEKALEAEDFRFKNARGWKSEIQPNLYRRRGDYELQLKSFLELFPLNQIHFIKSESLSTNTQLELRNLFDFLGVGYEELPKVPSFPSYSVRSARLQRIFRIGLGKKMDLITENSRKGSRPNSLMERLIMSNLEVSKLPMSKEARTLLNEYYSKSNKFVSDITGWDIKDWQ